MTYELASQDTLQETGAVTEDDKHHVLALDTETMHPTRDLDTLATCLDALSNFDLHPSC